MKKLKITKEQLLCAGAGILLGVLSIFTGGDGLLHRNGQSVSLLRPGYGEDETQVMIEAKNDLGEEDQLQIAISSRSYTPEEAMQLFQQMDEEVLKAMLGENADQMNVKTDLKFPSSLENYPGIELDWSVSAYGLIESSGTVRNAELSEPKEAEVLLRYLAGEETRELTIPVRILPAPERAVLPEWKERLEQRLSELDLESRTGERLELPEEFEGSVLHYAEQKDLSFLLFPALGLVCAVLLGLKPREDEKKRKKERELELTVDYSEIISKLIVYIGAGLTVRNAFHQLAENSRLQTGPPRAVYEEINRLDRELANGEPEAAAYLGFARRCELKCYMRMASLLEQNRKTGDSSLLVALELEMGDAFEQRKNIARRLGEEAGTKLIIPLILSLITVLAIVVIPAMTQMG